MKIWCATLPSMALYGGIEAGGTKFVCGVGTGPDDIVTTRIPTASPEATVARAVSWLREHSRGELCGVGIGSFGPVELNRGSPLYGHITSSPKVKWRNFDLAGAVQRGLGVPVAFETDVNAAVLGETHWGAARGVSNCLYLTVGTGIGGGAIVSGRLLHGLTHPEMGHVQVPHDLGQDPYPGNCPFHGDCLEGLASGPAMGARWGIGAEDLPPEHPAWALEARYLGQAIAGFICVLSPELIILGGGVMRQGRLYAMVRDEVARILGGYFAVLPEIVAPTLADLAGVLGAIALARESCSGNLEFQ